jgi:guanosine-3',5'-bis(diphosphate) 3'-pyrophosphohydrolase
MSSLILRASIFAEAAHAAVGQVRKYTGEPYIVHPRAVARLVQSVEHTEEMVAAALLHDVLEDTQVPLSLLRETFGTNIASMVSDLTDQFSNPLIGNRAFRKKMEAERLGQCSTAVQTIKVADMIDNTQSIVAHDPGFAKVYLSEKAYLLTCLKQADRFLVDQTKDMILRASADIV